MPRIRCPLSLMRSNLCRSGGSSGMLRPALRPRIGATCSLHITFATRKKATKLAFSGQILGKKSRNHQKSAMEIGSGGGSPGPRGGDLAPSQRRFTHGEFLHEDEERDGPERPTFAAEGTRKSAGRQYRQLP